jgi:hypothetical protein
MYCKPFMITNYTHIILIITKPKFKYLDLVILLYKYVFKTIVLYNVSFKNLNKFILLSLLLSSCYLMSLRVQ